MEQSIRCERSGQNFDARRLGSIIPLQLPSRGLGRSRLWAALQISRSCYSAVLGSLEFRFRSRPHQRDESLKSNILPYKNSVAQSLTPDTPLVRWATRHRT